MNNNKTYQCRAKVKHHDPMTNPKDGWVTGFYYQDLCGGEIRHFIRNGEMDWEVIPETVGRFIGYDTMGKEVYEGDYHRSLASHLTSVMEYNGESMAFGTHNYLYMPGKERHGKDIGWIRYCGDPFIIIGNIHDNPLIKEEEE